jgi:hypothetical protein
MLDWFLKPIPGPHQVYCFLTSSPNAVVEPSQSHAGHPADRRGTRGLDAHRGMKPRRYSGHCPTMRSGSSRAVWTRKTRPLHEYAADRLYADPAKAARRILEIVNALSQFRAASTSRKSTSRFYSATAATRPNTARASNSRPSAAGSRCMSQGLSSPSRRPARSCSLKLRVVGALCRGRVNI